jgi:hypothetical protein
MVELLTGRARPGQRPFRLARLDQAAPVQEAMVIQLAVAPAFASTPI